jgi:RND family efflux transporter MFP subunit
VKAGEVICRLEAPEVNSQRAESNSKVESARSQLAAVEAKLAADQSTYEKLSAAAKTPGVVAGNDLVAAQKAVEADQSQVKAAKSNADAAQQALTASTDIEKYLRIAAPFDGVITERNVHPGALVSANQGTPMLRLETLNHLRVIVPVPETDISDVPDGSTVEFTVPAFARQTFAGKVTRVSHAVDTKTRTMAVELDVTNKEGRLTPGSFAEVNWPLKRNSALLVPTTAVATNLERTFVVRIRDGKSEWVDVKRGLTIDKLVEVMGDLNEGDVIAVRATDEIAPGTVVATK